MSTPLLIVDDEPINQEIISEFLEDEPYSITLASSGEEAWALLDANPDKWNALLLDRMMPGMTGMDVLRKMKADPRLKNIPVIMQTAAAAPDQVAEGLQAGAYYYLVKPFERAALLSIVAAAVDDMVRWRDITERLSHESHALTLLDEARFCIRTLEDAERVALLIGSLAATPDNAVMGLSELLVNGVEHGNLGIDFAEKTALKYADNWGAEVGRRLGLPENADKRVRLHLLRQDDTYRILISDDGPGFDWQKFLDFDPERAFAPNGRGIAMARALAFTQLQYKDKGNIVELVMPAGDRSDNDADGTTNDNSRH